MMDMSRSNRADGEATRGRILEVAGEFLASKGLADTTSKEIAERAGVNMASINYHFGSRGGLYKAVLAEAHRRLIDRDDLDRLFASNLPAHRKLHGLIGFLVDGGAGAARWPIMVLGRELLSPSPHLASLQQEEIFPKLRIILPVLHEISTIPADDPVLWRCLPCVVAPCIMTVLLSRAKPGLDEVSGPMSREDLIDHLCRYAIGGLEAIGRAHGNET